MLKRAMNMKVFYDLYSLRYVIYYG